MDDSGVGAAGAHPGSADRPSVDPTIEGPLDRATAQAMLATGDELLGSGDFVQAARHYQRVIGYPEPAVTAAALYGLGEARFRLDDEDGALATWRQVLQLPPSPSRYRALRQIAALQVRRGELRDALQSYREAEHLAPPHDRPEIAGRLGWLSKELGDQGGARRWFAQSRTGGSPVILTYWIIGITVTVSLLTNLPDFQSWVTTLELDKNAVAHGEYWRLLTVTLVHAPLAVMPLHLIFNMYALYLAGTIVEQLYGAPVFALMYVLCGIAASVSSFLFGGNEPSVGASGAIFGLFGVLLAASRTHHPVLDRQGQMFLGQIGSLIVINLLFGFMLAGVVDNSAHVGGLIAGVWLGLMLVPGHVPTLARLWQRPPGAPPEDVGMSPLLRWLGVLALVVVIVVGVAIGTQWHESSPEGYAPTSSSAVAMEPG